MENKATVVFIEFLPRIQAVQFAVSDNCTNLSFSSCSLRTGRDGGSSRNVFCSWEPGSELHLPSYVDLKVISGEALHVRFTLKPHEEGGNGVKGREFAVGMHDEFSSGKQHCYLVLKCAFCHHCLTESNYIFRRVLPLPSEAWQEFSGNVFCHDHAHTSAIGGKVSASSATLLPREGDCLVNDSSVLVRKSALTPKALLVKAANAGERGEVQKVLCKRCLSYLGDFMISEGMDSVDVSREKGEATNTHPSLCSTPISLQRSQLILEEHSKEHAFMCNSAYPQLTARQTLEDYLARKLHTACKSKMAFRFLIQDKLKKTYLCVWMLNVITKVIGNSFPTGEASVLARFFNDDDDAVKNDCSTFVERCNLKLLYQYVLGSDTVAPWTEDISGVETFDLTTDECLWLVLILADSNRALPPSQRIVNGFRVGFLRLTYTTGSNGDKLGSTGSLSL